MKVGHLRLGCDDLLVRDRGALRLRWGARRSAVRVARRVAALRRARRPLCVHELVAAAASGDIPPVEHDALQRRLVLGRAVELAIDAHRPRRHDARRHPLVQLGADLVRDCTLQRHRHRAHGDVDVHLEAHLVHAWGG
eukprot:scaffold76033_cov56-Phaeocystis_antarctica.AAC.4